MVRKILLIDDEPQMLETLKMLLASRYDIIMSEDGPEGLELAKEQMPDLIILDIMMPGMDGFDVLKKLKEDKSTTNIPVIMLTAKSETDSIFRAEDLKAMDYVIKPYDGDRLLKLVKRHIG